MKASLYKLLLLILLVVSSRQAFGVCAKVFNPETNSETFQNLTTGKTISLVAEHFNVPNEEVKKIFKNFRKQQLKTEVGVWSISFEDDKMIVALTNRYLQQEQRKLTDVFFAFEVTVYKRYNSATGKMEDKTMLQVSKHEPQITARGDQGRNMTGHRLKF